MPPDQKSTRRVRPHSARVQRSSRLVDGLLSISRADAGQVILHKTPFTLFELAEEVVSLLGILAEEKGQRIAVTGDPKLNVHTDRMLVQRVLANILENAIKYSPPGTVIVIHIDTRVTNPGEHASISVQDDGEAIPEHFQEKVFDRFFRVDASRSREAGGSGLGLAIAKWAAEVNGGSLTLHSQQPKGNCFVISLPQHRIS